MRVPSGAVKNSNFAPVLSASQANFFFASFSLIPGIFAAMRDAMEYQGETMPGPAVAAEAAIVMRLPHVA
jgi:hypothetical protein